MVVKKPVRFSIRLMEEPLGDGKEDQEESGANVWGERPEKQKLPMSTVCNTELENMRKRTLNLPVRSKLKLKPLGSTAGTWRYANTLTKTTLSWPRVSMSLRNGMCHTTMTSRKQTSKAPPQTCFLPG